MGLLLVAGNLLVGQEVGVSQVGALSGGSLSVLPTQAEAPPEAGCKRGRTEGAQESEQVPNGDF